jgi:hypothetical protein
LLYVHIISKWGRSNSNTFLSIYLFSSTHVYCQCKLSFTNSTAFYKDLKPYTLAGIRTRDLQFWRRTRWPLCHAARHIRSHCLSSFSAAFVIPEDRRRHSDPIGWIFADWAIVFFVLPFSKLQKLPIFLGNVFHVKSSVLILI